MEHGFANQDLEIQEGHAKKFRSFRETMNSSPNQRLGVMASSDRLLIGKTRSSYNSVTQMAPRQASNSEASKFSLHDPYQYRKKSDSLQKKSKKRQMP